MWCYASLRYTLADRQTTPRAVVAAEGGRCGNRTMRQSGTNKAYRSLLIAPLVALCSGTNRPERPRPRFHTW